MKLTLRAPAKVNLDLRVLARESSGYHRIETLFLMVDLCDVVTVESAGSGVELTVKGADVGPMEENLAYRAANSFLEASGAESGVRIHLEKVVPAGAGLGGGSSDAAAVLRLMQRLDPGALGDDRVLRLGAELGADVPFFLCGSSYALGWGRGGRLLALPAPARRWVVLALSDLHVSTPDVYRALSREGLDPGAPRGMSHDSVSEWDWIASEARNDFERTVFGDHRELAELRRSLEKRGGRPARMSGSGAAVFAVFDEEARARAVADEIQGETGVPCRVVPTLTTCPAVEGSEG